MNELEIFRNDLFGEVRIVEVDGKILFVANDVARALGYTEPAKAIRTHCKGVSEMDIPTNGGIQKMKIIPEGDIYRLTVKAADQSKNEEIRENAEKFEMWIFNEVIPSIRKNGGYLRNQETLTPEQIVANALVVAQNIINQKNEQIQEMKPKAEFFDAVAGSKDAIAIGDVAKILDYKKIGRNKLFDILRTENVLMTDNRPYQKYIDNGWFRTIEQKYTVNDEVCINIKTLAYQKGIDGVRKILDRLGYVAN